MTHPNGNPAGNPEAARSLFVLIVRHFADGTASAEPHLVGPLGVHPRVLAAMLREFAAELEGGATGAIWTPPE